MKRGEPLKRRTELKSTKPLKSTPLSNQRSKLKSGPPKLRAAKEDPIWSENRAAAKERDKGCVARAYGVTTPCKSGMLGLEVHHILPRSRGGGHGLENLATLCHGHHTWTHAHPSQSKPLGLLR